MRDDLFDRLKLYRTKGIGSLSFRYLLKYHTAKDALLQIKESYKIPNDDIIQNEINNTFKHNANFIFFDEPYYPENLNIYNGPAMLIYKGNIDLLRRNNFIGIVGTRNPSAYALIFCEKVAIALKQDYTVVSGMALGIDTQAHINSMPNTIGIIPCGIDMIYPKENEELFNKMYKNSLIITEYACNSPIQKHNFIMRNYLIAALSDRLVLIEAGLNSGSLITAKNMICLKKNVFIMPGYPDEPRMLGSNELLESKNPFCHIFINVSSIFNNLNALFEKSCVRINFDMRFTELDKASILKLITKAPINIPKLLECVAYLPLNKTLACLAQLELENKITIYNQTVYIN